MQDRPSSQPRSYLWKWSFLPQIWFSYLWIQKRFPNVGLLSQFSSSKWFMNWWVVWLPLAPHDSCTYTSMGGRKIQRTIMLVHVLGSQPLMMHHGVTMPVSCVVVALVSTCNRGWRMEDGGWRMEDGGWRNLNLNFNQELGKLYRSETQSLTIAAPCLSLSQSQSSQTPNSPTNIMNLNLNLFTSMIFSTSIFASSIS